MRTNQNKDKYAQLTEAPCYSCRHMEEEEQEWGPVFEVQTKRFLLGHFLYLYIIKVFFQHLPLLLHAMLRYYWLLFFRH